MPPRKPAASSPPSEIVDELQDLLDKLAAVALAMKSDAPQPSTAFDSFDPTDVRRQLDREASLLAHNTTKLGIFLNEPPYDRRSAAVLCNDLYGIVERTFCIVDAIPASRGRQLSRTLKEITFDLLAALAALVHGHIEQIKAGHRKPSFATTGQVWDLAAKLKSTPLSGKALAAKELSDLLELLDDAIAEVESNDVEGDGEDDSDSDEDDHEGPSSTDSVADAVADLGLEDEPYGPEERSQVAQQGTNLLKLIRMVFQKLKKRCLVESDEESEAEIALVDEVADCCRALSEGIDEFAAIIGEKPTKGQMRSALDGFSEQNLRLMELGKQFGDAHLQWFETAERKWAEIADRIRSV
ncbi:hypothetical protein DFJ74DRAFT_705782 [Hyaloraphidium curvatum]|nr:hypothetical protein DFJ74DRAFT_705782 [Hyaloraphidium curvatum]